MPVEMNAIEWNHPLSLSFHSDLLNARIKGLSAIVTDINIELEKHGCHTGPLDFNDTPKKRDRHMDKVAYSSQMHRLHQNLISANQALAGRVKECKNRGMSPEDTKDAFWPNVVLPGSSQPATVVLKDYGKAVDNAFYALMNFLADVEPVDSLEFIKKRNTLLNDKLVSLMEIRKCQLQLLSLHDTGPFSLSQWTLFALREFSEGNPAVGNTPSECPSGIPLMRHNSDLLGESMND